MRRFRIFSVKPTHLSNREVATDGSTLTDGTTHLTLAANEDRWSFEGEARWHPFGKYSKSDKGEMVALIPLGIYGVPKDLEDALRKEGNELVPDKPLAESHHS